MVKDFSQFLGAQSKTTATAAPIPKSRALGWQHFFAQQVDIEELDTSPPVRVCEMHRNAMVVVGDDINERIPPIEDVTVGDWLLLDRAMPARSRRLERKSLVKRRAPGSDRKEQLIAANIDTIFIVTSCNQDFSVARLERYIALAMNADVTPVIVLTKIDLCDDVADYIKYAEGISKDVSVVPLDARSSAPRELLAAWSAPGQTIAFLGSSGVGKSTLTNALLEQEKIQTQGIREDDAKGRHTTTTRQLHLVEGGCAVLDTPGMRELQLTDVSDGLDELFADLQDLSRNCKFNDCQHDTEPGCAVTEALRSGDIDPDRFARWRKLQAEEAFNTASLAERKSKDKSLGKLIKSMQAKNSKR